MSKVTFQFDFETERLEIIRTIRSLDLILAISEFINYLRGEIKHNDNLTDEEVKIYEHIRDQLFAEFDAHDINLYTMFE